MTASLAREILELMVNGLTTPPYDLRSNLFKQTFLYKDFFLYTHLQTRRIMVWWCPSGSPSVRPTLRPPFFRTLSFLLHALTYWAEIFAHDFLLMYYRSSWSVVTLRQFLCRLQSIATHREHFVCRPSVCRSVRLSHFSVTLSKAIFRRWHMHSLECCLYFWRSYTSLWT